MQNFIDSLEEIIPPSIVYQQVLTIKYVFVIQRNEKTPIFLFLWNTPIFNPTFISSPSSQVYLSVCPSVCVFLVFQTNNFKIVYQCTENIFWGFSTNPKVTQQRDPIIFYVQLYTRDTIQLTNQSNHPAIPEHKKLTLEANPKAEFIVSAGKFMSISFSFFCCCSSFLSKFNIFGCYFGFLLFKGTGRKTEKGRTETYNKQIFNCTLVYCYSLARLSLWSRFGVAFLGGFYSVYSVLFLMGLNSKL